jgi:hypothetical protein
MHGQAYVAQTEFGQQLREDERVKISCARSSKIAPRARQASVK